MKPFAAWLQDPDGDWYTNYWDDIGHSRFTGCLTVDECLAKLRPYRMRNNART